jgi:glycosyltransferase involved in cell wall biosynthesis
MSGRLMVIVSEAISDWFAKGEVVDRYYNPGDLFDQVDVVLTNDDRPDPALLQRAVGTARVAVHNFPLPAGAFRRTLGYRPRLLRGWAGGVVDLARRQRPDLVRCHGANLNALAAAEIQRELGVPFAVSLHINPDVDVRGRGGSARDRLALHAMRAVERYSLRRADVVLPVYEAIVPYLERLGVKRYEVAYNSLNGEHLRRKDDYALHDPVRVISVGRLFELKNPEQLIRAVMGMDGVELTVVGDGPLLEPLRAVAGGSDRVVFRPAVANDELCELLAEQDLFATHTEHWEISKSVLEAMLTGLPVVLNRRTGDPVPELSDDIARFVPADTPDAWSSALRTLIDDDGGREALGRRAGDHARERWSPEATEQHFVEVYQRLLGGS